MGLAPVGFFRGILGGLDVLLEPARAQAAGLAAILALAGQGGLGRASERLMHLSQSRYTRREIVFV